MLLLFTVLIGLDVATSSVLPAVKHLGDVVPGVLTIAPVALVLQLLVGVAAGFVLFATVYFVGPNRRQSWREVLPGAAGAGVVVVVVVPLFLPVPVFNSRVVVAGAA